MILLKSFLFLIFSFISALKQSSKLKGQSFINKTKWESLDAKSKRAICDSIKKALPKMKPQGIANTIHGVNKKLFIFYIINI